MNTIIGLRGFHWGQREILKVSLWFFVQILQTKQTKQISD